MPRTRAEIEADLERLRAELEEAQDDAEETAEEAAEVIEEAIEQHQEVVEEAAEEVAEKVQQIIEEAAEEVAEESVLLEDADTETAAAEVAAEVLEEVAEENELVPEIVEESHHDFDQPLSPKRALVTAQNRLPPSQSLVVPQTGTDTMPTVIDVDKPTKEKEAPKGASTPPRRQRTPADRKLAEDLAGFYQMGGAVIMGLGVRFDDGGLAGTGMQTIDKSDDLAEAWLDYAEKNPKVKAALKRMTEATALGTLIAMHAMILTPFLVSRGIVPAAVAMAMSGQDQPEEAAAGAQAA